VHPTHRRADRPVRKLRFAPPEGRHQAGLRLGPRQRPHAQRLQLPQSPACLRLEPRQRRRAGGASHEAECSHGPYGPLEIHPPRAGTVAFRTRENLRLETTIPSPISNASPRRGLESL
jgi:hypothetical protein